MRPGRLALAALILLQATAATGTSLTLIASPLRSEADIVLAQGQDRPQRNPFWDGPRDTAERAGGNGSLPNKPSISKELLQPEPRRRGSWVDPPPLR
jgi:hypothetical protein